MVSGFNVGIVIFIIILLLRILRIPKAARLIITLMIIPIYCFMTGAATPVIRASIMAAVFMMALLIRREPDIYNSLSIAAVFILAFNPLQLFDIGFQLSFISVISIVYLYTKIRLLLRVDYLKNKPLRFLAESCLVSFAAWIGTLGFIAYYFRFISPVTVLANIIIVPLATLITLCGFALIMLPQLAQFFAPACELAVFLLLKANSFLVKLPAAYFHLP